MNANTVENKLNDICIGYPKLPKIPPHAQGILYV